jgi:hypothetical protein
VTTSPSDAPRVSRRGAHRAPRSTARRIAVVAVLAAVVAVAGVLLLVRPWARSDAAIGTDPALADLAPDVVLWLDEELPADTPVTAADDVRTALDAAGAGDRVGTVAEGALQVVAGEPPEGALVVARFESADGGALSVVDPAPGRPTAEELDRRQRLAAAILENPVADVTGHAADALRSGDVDARLLVLLAGLVARMDVHVVDLPLAPGQPPIGSPARTVTVDEAAGEPLTPGSAATEELVAFLEAQRPPFAPDTVEQTDGGVLVGFDYVSAPDAVVTAGT